MVGASATATTAGGNAASDLRFLAYAFPGFPSSLLITPTMNLRMRVGDDLRFLVRVEETLAPKTCAAFLNVLPFTNKVVQTRWSGEAAWVPMGDRDFGISFENHTSHPAPGQILLYPGGYSETELLIAYGACTFSSKMGQLAGNHFLTIVEGQEQLTELGRRVLWEGAQPLSISAL